jgi:hypothetical protein
VVTEEWRDIPGFAGYQASSLGRIRSRKKVLSQYVGGRGYLHVSTSPRVNGSFHRSVHVLVTLAFHGERPEGHQAAHGDDDKKNNRPGNLRWATPLENHADMVASGTHAKGEGHGMSKLTAADVLMIREVDGETHKALAGRFGVDVSTIRRVLNRRTWAWL